MSELLRATIALQENSIQMQKQEIERLTVEVSGLRKIIIGMSVRDSIPAANYMAKELKALDAVSGRECTQSIDDWPTCPHGKKAWFERCDICAADDLKAKQ